MKMEDGDFEMLVLTHKSESGPSDFIFYPFKLFSSYIFLKIKL